MDSKYLCDLIDKNQEELYNLLIELIGINSENFGSHGNEEECAKYIYSKCLSLGLECDIYSPLDIENFEKNPDYIPGHHLENRYNVTARWRGRENYDQLMLMGHLDTIEIGNLSNWNFDPLTGQLRDGKIYGRGACDDKYALATVMFIIKLLKEEGFIPKANLLFSAYSDEEHGGSHGAMAAVLKYPCENIVNMDGREGQIWHCASGGQDVTYRYHVDKTVDSAEMTAKAFPIVMEELAKFAQRREDELEHNCFYSGTIIPSSSLRYTEISAGSHGIDMGVGKLQFTYYTDKNKEEIYKEFSEIHAVLSEKLKPMNIISDGFLPGSRFFHYGYCDPKSDNIQEMLCAAEEANGNQPIVCGSCLSDLSIILKYGSPKAFAFGAGRDFSKPGGAHQPDEYIECEKLLAYAKTIAIYILRMLS